MGKQQQTPIEYAFLSMVDRLDRLAAVISDPYSKISNDKKLAIKNAAEAIEEEWILDPSMRAPREE
ncbi:hypothetical protein S-CBP2_0001 [Synechococcus phage S-CBP2]|uniref:Uncharacterized protein n=1 Tax=Synechococcus phage S-CBP2 TaxID=756277 RepID=A0A096VL00_9CAUD|nr:hypothetical protein S-CBP2_0001 [Synechococcus phage S-CBP2]AGF91129.1 hypothetical protein SXHG_00107 [Synechococcus phage MRHenn-2013a]AGK86707.1 hypothetical protein S-CBP2_0001 [Synechococcus phage S-CBP2]